ncbi:MAG: hypothetical protein SNJ71_00640 [Bacteroidales bacterium]
MSNEDLKRKIMDAVSESGVDVNEFLKPFSPMEKVEMLNAILLLVNEGVLTIRQTDFTSPNFFIEKKNNDENAALRKYKIN